MDSWTLSESETELSESSKTLMRLTLIWRESEIFSSAEADADAPSAVAEEAAIKVKVKARVNFILVYV